MKAYKNILRTIKGILIIVLVIVFVLNFYVMISTYVNKGKIPSVFGYSTAVVVSGSMSPTIEVNDLVIIKRKENYNIGDIIAYETGRSRVTHRIISKTPDGYITKGDANNAADQNPVPGGRIIGEVIYTLSGIGKATGFLQSPLGMMVIVLLAVCAVIIPVREEEE